MPQRFFAPDLSAPSPAATTPGQLSVNLSSDRVRVALSLIEGIRNGQSLGALLGYQFELGLHDDYTTRRSGQVHLSAAQGISAGGRRHGLDPDGFHVPIEAIEARNVARRQEAGRPDHQERIRPSIHGESLVCRRRASLSRPRSTARPTPCSTPTTRLPIWRSPKVYIRQCRGTTIASPAPSPRTRPATSRPSLASSTPLRQALA